MQTARRLRLIRPAPFLFAYSLRALVRSCPCVFLSGSETVMGPRNRLFQDIKGKWRFPRSPRYGFSVDTQKLAFQISESPRLELAPPSCWRGATPGPRSFATPMLA